MMMMMMQQARDKKIQGEKERVPKGMSVLYF